MSALITMSKKFLSNLALWGVALCLSLSCLNAQAAGKVSDPVVLRFSTVGDSRQDPKEADASMLPLSAQDKIWLQNTKAWSRIMRGIEGQQSKLLFFNGDMIMGYGLAGDGAILGNHAATGQHARRYGSDDRQCGRCRHRRRPPA